MILLLISIYLISNIMIKIFIEALGGQKQLSEALGCSQGMVSKWLSGSPVTEKWGEKFIELAIEKEIAISPEFIRSNVRTSNTSKNKELGVIIEPQVRPGNMATLPFSATVEKQQEIDGIGMGVLSDGTPFLNISGLARLCGVDEKTIRTIRDGWSSQTPRVEAIKQILLTRGVNNESFCIEIPLRSTTLYACTDTVSMAVLEYYAFDSDTQDKAVAQKNYRLLGRLGLRAFIYNQVGYDPKNQIPIAWQLFRDRIALVYNAVPLGYFCVFKEISDIIVAIIAAGGQVDQKFIPDISVGKSWAVFWRDQNFSSIYGEPANYAHNYSPYFPQAKSNPQVAKCYPEAALGEFRKWMREVYLQQGKFEKYLANKVSRGELPPSFAQLAVSSYSASLGVKHAPSAAGTLPSSAKS